jgi:calcineurin-like phosphoesterase family protein
MKIDTRDYHKVWLGSDFHYKHDRTFIWQSRGFPSCHAHDEALRKDLGQINSRDLLVYHGDWSLNSSQEEAEALFLMIPCPIIYIMGNHDQRVFRMMDEHKTKPDGRFGCKIQSDGFNIRFRTGILEAKWIKLDGSKQLISHSHYPLASWNHLNHGAWSVSGHEHNHMKGWGPGDLEQKRLDISKDSTGKFLLTFEELDGIMAQKKTVNFHHG